MAGQDWNWRMPSSSVSKNTKYFFAQEDSAFWMSMDILLSRWLPEGGCNSLSDFLYHGIII